MPLPFNKFVYKLSQRLVGEPIAYTSFAAGMILFAMSALNVTLSVSLSPIIIFPSAVILPVAFNVPIISKLEITSTVPVPLGIKSIFEFDL